MASEPDRPAHELKDLGYEQVLGDIDATIDAAEQRLFESAVGGGRWSLPPGAVAVAPVATGGFPFVRVGVASS